MTFIKTILSDGRVQTAFITIVTVILSHSVDAIDAWLRL